MATAISVGEMITGTVVNSENMPLEGVRVRIGSSGESVRTDESGGFSIDNPVPIISDSHGGTQQFPLEMHGGRLTLILKAGQEVDLTLITPQGRQKELFSGVLPEGHHSLGMGSYAAGIGLIRGHIGDTPITQKIALTHHSSAGQSTFAPPSRNTEIAGIASGDTDTLWFSYPGYTVYSHEVSAHTGHMDTVELGRTSRRTDSLALAALLEANPESGLLWDLFEGINSWSGVVLVNDRVTQLELSERNITELPAAIGNLDQLSYLDLNFNNLTKLPPETGNLSRLEALWLWGNNLTHLPPEIGTLKNLVELDLDENQLTEIPPEIGTLTNLEVLWLWDNNLTHLPAEIGTLTQVLSLDLDNNSLTSLPVEIVQISPDELFVDYNFLSEDNLHANVITWLDAYAPDWRDTQREDDDGDDDTHPVHGAWNLMHGEEIWMDICDGDTVSEEWSESFSDTVEIWGFNTRAGMWDLHDYRDGEYYRYTDRFVIEDSALLGGMFSGKEDDESGGGTWHTEFVLEEDFLVITHYSVYEEFDTDYTELGTTTLRFERYDGPVPPDHWDRSSPTNRKNGPLKKQESQNHRTLRTLSGQGMRRPRSK
jgi:hypothetical protein